MLALVSKANKNPIAQGRTNDKLIMADNCKLYKLETATHYKWSSSSQLECSDNAEMAYYVVTTTTTRGTCTCVVVHSEA
jgi:hypothetical protein